MARKNTTDSQAQRTEEEGTSRPIWRGTINFGLVTIPVALHSAEDADELRFRLLDRRNLSPVHYQRINEKTGKEVPWEQIVKGYEYEEGKYVPLAEEEFRRANVEATQTIEITDFVDSTEISPIYYDRPYYLEPLKNSHKSYALLREVMHRTGKVGIAKIVIRSRQHLAAVMPRGPILIVNLLRFSHELRGENVFDLPKENLRQLKIEEKQITMAERLVEAMVEKWAPEKYHDDYRKDLLKLIEKKIKSGQTHAIEEPEGETEPKRQAKVVNIMDLLKRSLEKAERGEGRLRRKVQTRRKAG